MFIEVNAIWIEWHENLENVVPFFVLFVSSIRNSLHLSFLENHVLWMTHHVVNKIIIVFAPSSLFSICLTRFSNRFKSIRIDSNPFRISMETDIFVGLRSKYGQNQFKHSNYTLRIQFDC